MGLPADLLTYGDFTVNGGYMAMWSLLHAAPANRPTAVLACNDLMAMGALRAVHESDLRVPQDVAIVGYDDIELASYTHPALTTVAQPVVAMAHQAMALLLDRMRAAKPAAPVVDAAAAAPMQLLAPALVTRASSKPVARPSGLHTLTGGMV